MIKTCSLLVFNIILQKAHKKAPKSGKDFRQKPKCFKLFKFSKLSRIWPQLLPYDYIWKFIQLTMVQKYAYTNEINVKLFYS